MQTLENYMTEPIPVIDLDKSECDLQCPYCCFSCSFFNVFIIKNKDGSISKNMAMCPRCKNHIRKRTLKDCGQKWTLEYYAYWVCDMREYDINGRLKWGAIKAFLKRHEITSRFWDAYYVRKKELHPEWVRKPFTNGEPGTISP